MARALAFVLGVAAILSAAFGGSSSTLPNGWDKESPEPGVICYRQSGEAWSCLHDIGDGGLFYEAADGRLFFLNRGPSAYLTPVTHG